MNLYPSVTEVLSVLEPLVWTPRLEAAGLRGTTVHDYAATHAKGFPPINIPEEWRGYYDSFAQWYELFVKEPVLIEERLVDAKLGFHGQMDLVFISRADELILADYKTSAVTQKKWSLQVSAYRHLAIESNHQIRRAGFVKLDQKGSPASFVDTLHLASMRTFNLFLDCLNLYRFLKA